MQIFKENALAILVNAFFIFINLVNSPSV